MTAKRVQWGRIRLEIGEERLRVHFAGSPRSDALLFGLLGLGLWGVVCIPCLVMKAKVSPWIYGVTGIPTLVAIGVGAAVGKRAQETGFVVSRTPTAGISLMQGGGEAIVLPAGDIQRFVTRERSASIGSRSVTLASLVVETVRGEFVLIPEMLINRKGADAFGRLLTALLLKQEPFDAAIREIQEVRRRDLIVAGAIVGALFVVAVLAAMFLFRHL